jgi:hypothetical protein
VLVCTCTTRPGSQADFLSTILKTPFVPQLSVFSITLNFKIWEKKYIPLGIDKRLKTVAMSSQAEELT